MNSNGSASRFPGLLRLKSPLKNFSMTINANAADEFFNFTSGGKKMTSNQPGTQCPDPRSPKYTLSSLKRFELPEKTSSAQSSLKSLLSSNTDRVKRANRNGKETHNRTDRTNEINTTIFDSSFTNLTSLVSPSNKTVISPSNKIRLKDLCKSASQQTLTHSNTNDSCSKEGDIPSKQGLQTTTGFNRRQLKASTEKLNNDLDVSCQIKPMAKERSSIGYYFGNLQKTAHGHRPARLRLTLTSNKSLSNLSLSRSGMEESMQQEAVKSVPSIKELYHESIMSKFDGFFDKTQTNGNTDRNDMIPSLLKIEEEKRAEPPLIPQEKEQEKEKDVAEKTSVSQAKVLAHSDLINKLIHPRKLQTTRREPYKFGKKGVIDPNLKQAIEKRLNLSMAQENVNRQSLTQFHTVANKSPRKSVKKPLRVISSKKELWIKCFDNEQIEIPEKSLGTKFIPPPQNPLVSSSSFQKLQSKEITIPAKRDFKKVRVAFIEAVRNIKLLKLTPKDVIILDKRLIFELIKFISLITRSLVQSLTKTRTLESSSMPQN